MYKKYYEFQNSGKSVNIDNMFIPIIFQTGYQSSFERNRIIFGAPGTGKSFKLNCEKDALLADDRVTAVTDFSFREEKGSVTAAFTVYTIFGEVTAERTVDI